MIFSYRTRQLTKRISTVLLYVLLISVVLIFCLLLWLQRYLVYTPEGAHLDFSVNLEKVPGNLPQAPNPDRVTIDFGKGNEDLPDDPQPDDPTPELPPDTPQTRWDGYYIPPEALQNDIAAVRAQLEALPAGTPVLLDVVSHFGNFYYSSAYGNTSTAYNIPAMDALLRYLAESELYVIAKFPALRNYNYALNHTAYGLATEKGYLWTDAQHIYWLDPTKDGTLTYLIQVIKELRTLGFDEVVLQDFYVPEGETIKFSGQRQQVIDDTAQSLVTACATDSFTVSFVAQSPSMRIPESRSRLYLMDVPAADVGDFLAQMQVEHKETDVVIIAQSYDTRYDICSTLHPLDQAH